jgi:hypothetical protein
MDRKKESKMDRSTFHRLFKTPGPVVTPVIHVLDRAQALANIAHVARLGAAGVFLINHDFPADDFLPILRDVRSAAPDIWMGVNFLAQPGRVAFPILGRLAREGCQIDAYWADDACMDVGGVCFKKQRPVDPALNEHSARIALPFLDVVTTSGVATGQAADMTKITDFRRGLGQSPLAIASGITPDNAAAYAANVDCFLVATGINRTGDFYNIDPARLSALLDLCRAYGEPK